MTLTKRIKSRVGHLLFSSGAYQRFLRNKAVVVLFHRVDDRLSGNPISCTSAEFKSFCRFFKKYFKVVPFSELLDRVANGDDISGMLSITFDDGYRDNFTIAAPILAEEGLPCCFFIATDFIGSERIPWWDANRGIHSEWMDWSQIRALRTEGFEIGAHTCNHIDLGETEGTDAEREILESRHRLEQELGEPVTLFSYPFGGCHQMADGNREIVKRLGFRCCPSAYGGVVMPGADPFHLMRQPISPWHISPYQFGLEMLLE